MKVWHRWCNEVYSQLDHRHETTSCYPIFWWHDIDITSLESYIYPTSEGLSSHPVLQLTSPPASVSDFPVMATQVDQELDALFPLPTPPPAFAPQRLPGITHGSSATLVKILKENHTRWHTFFNDIGFHKYAFSPATYSPY